MQSSTVGHTSDSPEITSVVESRNIYKNIFFPVVSAVVALAATSKAYADDAVVAEPKAELGPAPTDFGLTYSYYEDAAKVIKMLQ